MFDDHYLLHRHESKERIRDASLSRAALAGQRRRRAERAAQRRARLMERTALILASVSGWTGGLARRLHSRAIARRASVC
ncbi:hypothetical protein [Phytoactinopolyspora mesophila]|uniref:Uncharacterized protein n=1 Tax=Phytoactinopolyspora mesophila TaxID=2650750 RepID=A0A7K3M503_9ACTN|nr:hypothetical protein [Phytoactinopolyspora mesophila]NDL58012.1 hypothetical protein [Phytoactinopolyspora mesophila]